MPRCRTAGSYGNSTCNSLRNCHTLCHSSCNILHSHQKHTSVSISLHPQRSLPFSIWCEVGTLSGTLQETVKDTDQDSGDRIVLQTDLELIQQEMGEAMKDKCICWWQSRREQEVRTKPGGIAQLGGTLIHKRQLLIVFQKLILWVEHSPALPTFA